MGEVVGVATYPLTGGRAYDHGGSPVQVLAGGLENDRLYVPYSPHDNRRVGIGQYPGLTAVRAEVRADPPALILTGSRLAASDITMLALPATGGPELTIDEFGDPTPIVDCGDIAANAFSNMFGNDLRLGRKTADWMNGAGIDPALRRVAPLHIVNEASVRELKGRHPEFAFDALRFRGNLLVDGFEPFSEADWVGRQLRIGSFTVEITRRTTRCPAPGFDPHTGENLKDVPKMYREFVGERPDGTGKPTFGVYGYPIAVNETQVYRGAEVSLLD